jgi:selenocysteine lyase/cysteine desulfurase/tRNA(Ile)-lysidine synthase TilS/MesJ
MFTCSDGTCKIDEDSGKMTCCPLTGCKIETKVDNQKYIENLYSEIIGNDVKFKSPYGEKSVIYVDYTASGRGLKKVEEFISNQILPFYANVHSTCGYLAEQSENFRIEAKTIVRRYLNTDEKDSIIFAGQGTTSCVNKLIKLMNLSEYVRFYRTLKKLNQMWENFQRIFNKEESEMDAKIKDNFLEINSDLIQETLLDFSKLFQISNFCYSNRWGSFDCVLCRMTFLQESQYNEHERQDIHKNNIEKCASVNSSIFKVELIKSRTDTKDKNFIFELMSIYENFEPIVYLSILEHNSNALPWRETGAKIIYINFENKNPLNQFDYKELESSLQSHKDKIIKMGSFTAGSNITGVYLDVDLISLILHKNNALAFFDYATAAPYVKIDMNKPLDPILRKKLNFVAQFTPEEESLIYKDSLFFSPHKLLGGPNTPGVLIIKQHVVRNLLIPSEPGGGVVLFVRQERQNYVKNIEAREESGTPDIIGSVRIGLSLLIREKISDEFILNKEEEMNKYILERFSKIPNLLVLGLENKDISKKTSDIHKYEKSLPQPRIPIYSFVIKFKGKLLHHNFVSALLNDLFGIQSRPGCSCASTYGQLCLGLEETYTETLEKLVCSGLEVFRPGYTRVNFPYFYPQYIIDYILYGIEFVAKYGFLFLPHYAFKTESGKYYHRGEDSNKRKWLNEVIIEENKIELPNLMKNKESLTEDILKRHIECAENILRDYKNITKHTIGKSKLNLKILFSEYETERWFLLPDDVESVMYNIDLENLVPGEGFDKNNKNLIEISASEKLSIKYNMEFLHPINSVINILNKESEKSEILSSPTFEQKNLNKNISNEDLSSISLLNEINFTSAKTSNKLLKDPILFPEIPKKIIKLVGEASKDFDMLRPNDRILIGMSGGKDSTTLLHALLYFQKKVPFKIEIAGVTVDPMSSDYDPSPLIDYMKKLGVNYFYEKDPILERAKKSLQNDSICAYCARMKRGIIYNCARREGYNVIALGQHLDDLAESFLMSSFHNGLLRTMKANYVIDQGDLRVIRPLIYCREKLFKEFVLKNNVPVIQENCPACFSAPKERHRVKVLLAQQENLFPSLFSSLQKAMVPLMKGAIEGENKKDDLEI